LLAIAANLAAEDRKYSPSSVLPAAASVDTALAPPNLSGRLHNITSTTSNLSAVPELEVTSESAPAVVAVAPLAVEIEAMVKRVHYRSLQTGYAVMRVTLTSDDVSVPETAPSTAASIKVADRIFRKASSSPRSKTRSKPKRREITVVGLLPQVSVGQTVRFFGEWTNHVQYGAQFRATDVQEMKPGQDTDLKPISLAV